MKSTKRNMDGYNCSDDMKLRGLNIDDFSAARQWSEDVSFCSANGWEPCRNSEQLYNWWLRCIHNQAEDFVRLGIVYEDVLIGYADLAGIYEHTAELGVEIGDSKLWGKGLGYRAARCMIKYGVEELGIKLFNAETDNYNVRSQKMLEKLGFQETERSDNEPSVHVKQHLLHYQLHL